ncbi:actinorhodin polyketide synthase acyl carrier protein [Sphaerisporangium melleum]|uniref:Actinorhodin polyketide synthase acyl carrier protein n=1 Tax=Sphaerisporangium melleum TaxID=321316 RepID=A0A917VPL0_9ACTN|nr:acyl carrier protein [Sphaerisporangium melleum]GGL01880.1 actinorhodin polyketide synthase acyl carrier protein [Sphaerisporangium melleum]GII72183.1 actinorhodin polyketide synthase acyl carrier protein [Sphaerisporangium melleum]
MTTFTLDDMRRIMGGCAGVPESLDLADDIGEIPFTDLGYDSLAVLEMAARIQQELGVRIPDDAVDEMKTPQAAVDYVNRRLAA